jgi:ABC-type multidrug transport system fused ATPase/permease subunit
MKKILYILLAVTLAFVFSSYTNNIEKSTTKDTVLVKVDVKQSPRYQKGDEPIYKKLTEALESYIITNQSKQLLLEDYMQQESVSKLEILCQEVNITSDELFKKARADTVIRFWSNITTMVIFVLCLWFIITKSNNKIIPWQNIIIVSTLFIILIFLLKEYSYNILSYLFNSDYLKIKEIINLIK